MTTRESPDSARRRALRALGVFVVGAHVGAAWTGSAAAADLPEHFDPGRDAAADLARARALATATGRRVLIDVGGEWCTWCHIMDRFFAAHPELLALRERHYVWLKVNYSTQNRNEALLQRWPKVAGYPHWFVLTADGTLVRSQDTGVLEAGRDYDPTAMRVFLTRYAAPAGVRAPGSA
ncbi:MAG: thioredoxin family protein [Casimicrobiaceae bacterium]